MEKKQKKLPKAETDTEFGKDFSISLEEDPAENPVMSAIQQMYTQSGFLYKNKNEDE